MHKGKILLQLLEDNGWVISTAAEKLNLSIDELNNYLNQSFLNDGTYYDILLKLELFKYSESPNIISEDWLDYFLKAKKNYDSNISILENIEADNEAEKSSIVQAHKFEIASLVTANEKKLAEYRTSILTLSNQVKEKEKELNECYNTIEDQSISIDSLIEIQKLDSKEMDRLADYQRPTFLSYLKELFGLRLKKKRKP